MNPKIGVLLTILVWAFLLVETHQQFTLATGDQSALLAIANHFATGPSVDWGNAKTAGDFSGACPNTTWSLAGVACYLSPGSNTSYVQWLTISGFAWESNTPLPYIGGMLSSNYNGLAINQNLSEQAQSSLFSPSMTSLYYQGAAVLSITTNTSVLTGLTTLEITSCSQVTSIPSFASSPSLTMFVVSTAPALTSILGPFPSSLSTAMLQININNAPMLNAFPALTSQNSVTAITMHSVNLTSIQLPIPSNTLLTIALSNLPSLSAWPDLSNCMVLSYFTISNCPLLPSIGPTSPPTPSYITYLTMSGTNLSVIPPWVCNLNTYVTNGRQLDLSSNNIALIPDCISSISNITSLKLSNAGPRITDFPSAIFNTSTLAKLEIDGLDFLVTNTSLQMYPWNLPFLTYLSLPSNFLSYGLPPPRSSLGSAVNPTAASNSVFWMGPQINASIPDWYFNSFSKFNYIVAPSLGIFGSLPQSLGNLASAVNIQLSSNDFSGTIPASLFALPSLSTLGLAHNNLTGNISALAMATSQFNSLDLSYNFLDLCVTPKLVFPEGPSSLGFCLIGGYCNGCNSSLFHWTNCTAACLIAQIAPTCSPSSSPQITFPPSSPPPSSAPASAPTQSTPVQVPPVQPYPSCSNLSPPSVGIWSCTISPTSGIPIWVSNTSIITNQPIIISSNLTIEGNLTSPLLVIPLSSTVNITDCANISHSQRYAE